jgi:hypothetical protein
METPCIEYDGYLNKTGYGKLKVDGRWWLAHRLAWTKAHGPIPDGLFSRRRSSL